MSYKFQITDLPKQFKKTDFFNSVNFWNYQKELGVESFYIQIVQEEQVIGYIIVSKRRFFNINVFGSPIRGIGADFQGFTIFEDYKSSIDANLLLSEFAKFIRRTKLTPVRILERNLEIKIEADAHWKILKSKRYILNLEQSIENIKKGFSYKSAVYEINKAQKKGIYVKREKNIELFLDIHLDHLENVFKRKNLPVPHSKKRLIKLFNSLEESQYLLMIAFNADGLPIASNTYLVGEELSYFYTAASLTDFLKFAPNEILMFESIIELKNMGSSKLEFGRGMDYKKKYGPSEIEFLELFSNDGYWKIELIDYFERTYKKLRKNEIFKKYINKSISRLMHYKT